ncbi:MAG: FliM/FliN family flagellar motor switch protein [Pirellulaceae bacterium]|jgi:flagellar motor switch protein FliM|nr:FliM/FliN family flagellar motor switch protein [Pirellulaceae bacterium]
MEEQDRTERPLLESLLRMHDQLRLPLEQALAELLHCDLQVSLSSVDRRRFSESLIHASKPSCRLRLNVPGAHQGWMVDLGPCLVLPIAHRLLGGHTSLLLKPDRPFTELERRLMRCVVRPLAGALDQQWQGILPGPLQLAEETPSSGWLDGEEEIFQVVLAVFLEQHQGFLTLCMPARMIEEMAGAILSEDKPCPSPGKHGQEEAAAADDVRVSVHLPATEIAVQDLEGLQVGEIITTDIASDVPVEMQLDGRPLYQSEAGIVDGRLAVRITGLLDSDDPAHEDGMMPADETTT